jgi:hypothetical protein
MLPGRGTQHLFFLFRAYTSQRSLLPNPHDVPDLLPRNEPVLEDMGSGSFASGPIAE